MSCLRSNSRLRLFLPRRIWLRNGGEPSGGCALSGILFSPYLVYRLRYRQDEKPDEPPTLVALASTHNTHSGLGFSNTRGVRNATRSDFEERELFNMDKFSSEQSSSEIQQTLKVAKSFRGVLTYFGLQYLIGFGMQMAGGVAQASPDAAPLVGLVFIGGVIAAVVCLVMLLVSVYKCSSAMGAVGVLWVIAMFFPCLNLITLLAINSKAKSFLENRGVKVGFLGPSPEEIYRLERAVMQQGPGQDSPSAQL